MYTGLVNALSSAVTMTEMGISPRHFSLPNVETGEGTFLPQTVCYISILTNVLYVNTRTGNIFHEEQNFVRLTPCNISPKEQV